MRRLTITNGWLDGVHCVVSPNYDARPANTPVDTLVVHGITLPPGCFGHGYIHALFSNRLDPNAHPYFAAIDGLRVSAHAGIARTGAVTQYVSFDARAWHAGASSFESRAAVNDFGVGVELEGTDDCPYAPAQYRSLAALTAALMRAYPQLTRARIVGHSDIAPGRKTDPGPGFDWQWLGRLLDCWLL